MTRQLTRRELLFGRRRFADDESGATAIEYGLIAGLVAVVIAVPLIPIGKEIVTNFHCIRFKIMDWKLAKCR
ncbi:MAG: Flp family type IVb pilin [Phyllobacteriaceae bacterium]|nr:Flp family type IVb pilin [Phyllobacteriaceae bacterium]MBA89490.1 Flp family type IVb pilin [Phyllobacteriaceae bacterium]MBA90625.1 Flp family type IVb pilin [Phyllobacteriaceae bacterium]